MNNLPLGTLCILLLPCTPLLHGVTTLLPPPPARHGTAILWTNNDDGLFRKLLLCLCAIASSKASSAATYRLPDSHLIQHVFSPQMANAAKRNSCHPTRAVHFYSCARECERGSSLFFHCFISNVGGCVCGGSSSTVSGMVELMKMQYYFNSKSISISSAAAI